MAAEPFLVNPRRRKRSMKHNPFGAELAILGGLNPRRRKLKANPWYDDSLGHKKAARKGWKAGHKAVKKHHKLVLKATKKKSTHKRKAKKVSMSPYMHSLRRTSSTGATPFRAFGMNPRHRSVKRRRSMRRNPLIPSPHNVVSAVKHYAPIVLAGGASIIVNTIVPNILGLENPWYRMGAKAATSVGGGVVLRKYVSKDVGNAWMVAGLAVLAADAIQEYVINKYLPSVAERQSSVSSSPIAGFGVFAPQPRTAPSGAVRVTVKGKEYDVKPVAGFGSMGRFAHEPIRAGYSTAISGFGAPDASDDSESLGY